MLSHEYLTLSPRIGQQENNRPSIRRMLPDRRQGVPVVLSVLDEAEFEAL
ncbi:hypothetical protein [Methylocaldum sp.]|nr:hypothetical protein [Methylocaldum sp.]HYE34491.1 hypothetical protein [Methylocaldum sp.]